MICSCGTWQELLLWNTKTLIPQNLDLWNVLRSLVIYHIRYPLTHDFEVLGDYRSSCSFVIIKVTENWNFSCQARRIIAMLGQDFILDGSTILVHGFSRVVLEILRTAAQNKKHFRVFCTGHILRDTVLLYNYIPGINGICPRNIVQNQSKVHLLPPVLDFPLCRSEYLRICSALLPIYN